MDLHLVHANDPILKQKCQEFDFKNPSVDPIEFAQALTALMYAHNGLGLSANQTGFNIRVFAMRGDPQNFVCFNPRIVWVGERRVTLEEGCLSYPGLIIPVSRFRDIRVRFYGANQQIFTQKFTDLSSRVFQHEMMHLDGENFWASTSRTVFEMAKKKCNIKNVTFNGLILDKTS